MSSIDNSSTSIKSLMSTMNLGSSGSLQFQFAALQLALSEASKSGAMSYMDQIQKSHDEQQKVSAMLQELRNLKENGSDTTITLKADHVLVSWETSKYMVDNGLAVAGDITTFSDTIKNTSEGVKEGDTAQVKGFKANGFQVPQNKMDILLESLQGKLDSLGTDTQQKMIYVQDFMGQYNSYLTGSNSVIQQANATLAELAKAR